MHVPGKAASRKGSAIPCAPQPHLWFTFERDINIPLLPCQQVQSFKSRVLFREACAAFPEDAVLLEVGPHAILRSPLRQVATHPALQLPLSY